MLLTHPLRAGSRRAASVLALAARRGLPTGGGDLSRLLFWPLLAGWFALKCWLTFTRYINSDGFECMHQGWLLFAGHLQYIDFKSNHPPLPFQVFGLLNYLSADPVTVFLWARLLTLISSVTVLYLVWRIARDTFGECAARWAVMLLAASILWTDYSTMVRMDLFMTPLWLGAVALLVGRGPLRPGWRMFWIGLLGGLSLWSNQKVGLLALPCAAYVLLGAEGRWRWRHFAAATAGVVIPSAFYVAHAAWNGALAALYASNVPTAAEAVDTYAYAEVRTLLKWFRCDPAMFLLTAAALGWGLRRWRECTGRQRFVLAYGAWLWATLFITPVPFPYYLACLFPLMAVCGGGLVAAARPRVPRRLREWRLLAAGVLLVLAMPAAECARLLGCTAEHQFRTMRLATALAEPNETVFDGCGAVFTRPDAYRYDWIFWWAERRRLLRGELPPLATALRENECRLVVYNGRISRLPPEDAAEIWSHFVRLWGPLFVPGYDTGEIVGEEPHEFDLWYDGWYECHPVRLRIDGRQVDGPVWLAAGPHEVAVIDGPARVTIRDASHRERIKLPPPTSRTELFD